MPYLAEHPRGNKNLLRERYLDVEYPAESIKISWPAMQNPSDNRCRFPSSLSEADFGDFLTRGDPWIFKKLGPRKGETMNGWSFSVWAPRAQSVSLVVYSLSDPPVDYEMFRIGSTGVWEVFLAEVYSGTKYKFHLKTPSGEVLEKADPMGVFSEGPPHNASVPEGMPK